MKAPVTTPRAASGEASNPLEEVVVGKDILELVSTAMYTDPLTIYREYVQNAADAIDMACAAGVLASRSEGRIHIRVEPTSREAWVRDNGSGIPAESAVRVLSAIGASDKRGQAVRGFRGIGRLAALGFCQFITFTTKAQGEPFATQVKWDCRRLKALLRDTRHTGSLAETVREAVSVNRFAADDHADHYFEVHLEHVVRLRGDALLNEEAVSAYLAQVAPVPFGPEFPFAAQIEEFLRPHLPGGHFTIVVGDDTLPLVRPHAGSVRISQTKRDSYVEWEPITIEDPDLIGPAAVGWVAHHNYLGAIADEPEVRGFRARVGDIQVGDDDVFAGIFRETRFNNWVIGELHVLDPRIVPNGRRDNFEHHPAVASLFNQLGPIGRALTLRTRESSKERARLKAFEAAAERAEAILATLEEGLVQGAAAGHLLKDVDSRVAAMDRTLDANSPNAGNPHRRAARLNAIRERCDALRAAGPGVNHPLRHLAQPEREFYDRVMGLVFECVDDPSVARTLLQRVSQKAAVLGGA